METFSWRSLRSFQFRLLLYLLLVGSIPLLLAVLVFYRESASYARHELSENARRLHVQIAAQIQQELQNMEMAARNVAGDYALQQYIAGSRGAAEGGMSDAAMLARLKELRETIVGGSRYTTDVCVFVDSRENASFCSSTDAIPNDSKLQPQSRSDKFYRMAAFGGSQGAGKSYNAFVLIAPLPDQKSGVVRGQVVVVSDASKLLRDMAAGNPALTTLTIYDEQGVGYSSDKTVQGGLPAGFDNPIGAPVYADGRIVSKLPVDTTRLAWYSWLEMRSDAMTQTWRSLRNSLVLLLVVLLVLSLASTFLFTRLLTKPLNALRKLMKRAEAGDWKAYWTARGTKEIDDVGDSYNQMLYRLEELFRRFKREEALKKEAEIEALQYQLNPHFLYNTLNTIKWVAKIHKTPQISDAVSALVRLLQASLGKKGDFLTIKKEVSLIRDYMDIQTFRYGERIKLVVDVDPLASLCLVPRMMMQPLVENAIIHGIAPSGRDGVVTVKAWLERDLLICQVEDNGVGMEEPAAEAGTARTSEAREKLSGIGLAHIREKIKLYYGPDYKLYTFSKRDVGTTVRMSLPIHRGEEWTG